MCLIFLDTYGLFLETNVSLLIKHFPLWDRRFFPLFYPTWSLVVTDSFNIIGSEWWLSWDDESSKLFSEIQIVLEFLLPYSCFNSLGLQFNIKKHCIFGNNFWFYFYIGNTNTGIDIIFSPLFVFRVACKLVLNLNLNIFLNLKIIITIIEHIYLKYSVTLNYLFLVKSHTKKGGGEGPKFLNY